jgi:hypothetical protein
MATTKDRLFGPALVATGPTTVVTAAATERLIIWVIWVSNPTASAVNFTASIGADAAGTRIIGTNTVANVPANSVTPFYGPFVVKESEIVQLSAGTNNVLNASAFGERRSLG